MRARVRRQCRWNGFGECSFHHGVPEACRCESTRCPLAHPTRVRRNAEARQERKREIARDRPGFAERNSRTLFLGASRGDQSSFDEAGLRAVFRSWITTSAETGLGDDDPVVGARIRADLQCAFVELRTPEIATACLSAFDGLTLAGWGKVRLQRVNAYDPSSAPIPDPGSVVVLDASRLDVVEPESGKARKKRDWENKQHYQSWKSEQKALETGETGQQLRERYLQLFPERRCR